MQLFTSCNFALIVQNYKAYNFTYIALSTSCYIQNIFEISNVIQSVFPFKLFKEFQNNTARF